ncbi:MAG: preprotein translocase subunit YajC [Candidatus Ruthia sp.]|jgi:preprotein translocase subunit YajC|nr:preprotein translocase subunit YajC [Candidatus Ruthturnera sp.]MDG2353785.1 preprotein translocase subunit YajC [Gammaproteobacteria bacterium]
MNLLDLIVPPAFAAADGINSDPSGLSQLILPGLLLVVMYVLLIRPQQKRAKDHKALLAALKKGDEVVTNGGIVAKVASVDESFATLEIADGVVVKVQKQGINQKLPKGSAKI